MDTYFAAPGRANEQELRDEFEIINHNPVVNGLLCSISGLLAVLDEHRQVIAVNDKFLEYLGLTRKDNVLGLRPGEAVRCVNAHEGPGGCGTGKTCRSCGAAIAIMASLENDKSAKKLCALTVKRDGREVDLALQVRSQPLMIGGKKFLLFFLQDVTRQQQRAALERTFFHDVNNLLHGLVGASELLVKGSESEGLAQHILQTARRMAREVEIQRSLAQSEAFTYQPQHSEVTTAQVLAELQNFYSTHPVAQNKTLHIQAVPFPTTIETDFSLLLRVLCNMVTNALEATDNYGSVNVWLEEKHGNLNFHVWNRQAIPEETALRIFQRNASTKPGEGRGLGTFSMKLFGEQVLGGKISFTTSPDKGTIFRLELPLKACR